MSAGVTTRTTELADSRVRLDVEVGPEALEEELASAARDIGRDLKLPGFRQGRVPAPVVLQRVGRDAVLDQAVRRGLPAWYEQAVGEARIATMGDPKVDLGELPERGAPLAFSVEVAVRPKARLGDYRGLEVGRREPEVSEEDVARELDRLRESVASLETVERPAASGDFVVIDFVGRIDGEPFTGGEARGFLLELGSGRLLPGFEDQLTGAAAGDAREVTVTFPDDYQTGPQGPELAGQEAVFAVEVKEVKEKRLPDLDDDFATEAGGFDTLDELREDIRANLTEAQRRAIDGEFREAVVDAVAAASTIDLPQDLVHAKAHEMWENTARRLRAQGMDPARYLELTGKDEHDLIDEAEPEARRALERESVLAAVVETEGIEVSDEEVLDALRQAAAGSDGRQPSEKALRRSFQKAVKRGRDELLREDIAMRKAVDLLVEHARPIPAEQARARDELWTPEKERPAEAGQLWTPGS